MFEIFFIYHSSLELILWLIVLMKLFHQGPLQIRTRRQIVGEFWKFWFQSMVKEIEEMQMTSAKAPQDLQLIKLIAQEQVAKVYGSLAFLKELHRRG